ncbi:MAG: hypothetical protein EXX96DRAFT_488883 [Benjaminiella poitrasii]|nr:MAG: hypothetical protein EXX96DRAFT_488883 [Benjaminiella poitrasii]
MIERRNSGSSQGSTSSSLAAEQRLRRKEQNRAAQRAFRERKERYVKELEDKIKEIEAKHAAQIAQLKKENEELRRALSEARGESPTSRPATDIAPTITNTSAVACIRDKNGISFCERLKEEVCSNAYEQLLTEPLFDSQGYLNETIVSHPVPIVTNTTPITEEQDAFSALEKSLLEIFSPSIKSQSSLIDDSTSKLISCAEIWNAIAEHPRFDEFDTDMLCDVLRKRAKCSKTGPVFEEHEIGEVVNMMLDVLDRNKKQQEEYVANRDDEQENEPNRNSNNSSKSDNSSSSGSSNSNSPSL